jgi:chitinase
MPKSAFNAATAAILCLCACGGGAKNDGGACANAAPEAVAGPPQSAAKRATVHLSGSAAKTTGAVIFAWRLDSPEGSKAALSSSSVAAPTFTADVAGDYVATLFVRDGCATSAPSTAAINVINHAPAASAGPDRQAMPGDTVTLDGSGTGDGDADNLTYHWSLISRPPGSTASLSNESASAPTFTPDAYGTYVAILVVSDGEDSSLPDDVIVRVGATGPTGTCAPAALPIAAVGPDQSVSPFSSVQLDASASTTSRPGTLTFNWTLISVPSGSNAWIDTPHTARPFLFAVDRPGTYQARLVVNDGCADSAPATVRIVRQNSVPSAYAFLPSQAPILLPFNLQGNAYDYDSEPLTYRWQILSRPAGSTAAIVDPTAIFTSFTPDLAGSYTFSFTASDAASTSTPSQGTVTVLNQPPTARTGADHSTAIGALVTLDGSASSDASQRPLTFAWTLQPPAGSTATLSSTSAAKPTFTADVTGVFRAHLTVTAGGLSSEADTTVAVWPSVKRLSHRVIDAAYSASLERVVMVAADPNALYLFDPRGPAESSMSLSAVPTSVSLDPAGHFAVVGHAGAISYVDLQSPAVVRVLPFLGDVSSLALGDNGFAFAFQTGPTGDHVRLLSLPVAGGSSSLTISNLTGAGRGRFRPVSSTLYVAANGGFFGNSGIEEYAVGTGTPGAVAVPAGLSAGTCGDLWLAEAGNRLFTRCGTAYRASSSATDDLSAAGTLPRPSGVSLLLRHLSDSTAASEISAVASADDPFVFAPADDRTLRRWASNGFAQKDSLPFPSEVVGSSAFRWQGRFVFYRSDGSERYVVMQLEPAAGALLDFGMVIF